MESDIQARADPIIQVRLIQSPGGGWMVACGGTAAGVAGGGGLEGSGT